MKPKAKRRLKLTALFCFLFLLLIPVVVWAINWRVLSTTRDRMYTVETLPEGACVGVVLGARVYASGSMPAVTSDRVNTAVELYQAGKIEKILMSGDNGRASYDEVTTMRNFAVQQGVPPDDVVRDYAGFRTHDSIYRARDVWGLREFVVITQEFHLPRALYIADGLGVEARGGVADRNSYLRINGMTRREILARVGAWLDLWILRTKPRFLGAPETLSGLAQEEAERRKSGAAAP